MKRRASLTILLFCVCIGIGIGIGPISPALWSRTVNPPAPFGPLPSPRQLQWHEMEFYGQPEYLTYFRNQLRELLTGYGPIFEVFFDGANGGDGYYGGARETRHVDIDTYYDWAMTWQLVRDLQPGAVLFSDAGPDVRWVGNERGVAGETCWATSNSDDFVPGRADATRLNRGDRPGRHWVPAECDVSIRPGWFYHAREDDKVRTGANLVDLYYSSVGRGASLLLNLPPDRRGRIHGTDAHALNDFRRILDATFAKDFAAGATSRSTSSGFASIYRSVSGWRHLRSTSGGRVNRWNSPAPPASATPDSCGPARSRRRRCGCASRRHPSVRPCRSWPSSRSRRDNIPGRLSP